ncbi:DUF1482 family protein [Raoultella terrigena]|uniref:DUF1482 family protein n=1 Tax=Raoultella terrigena TaxID=577 RepID=UPI00384AF6EB
MSTMFALMLTVGMLTGGNQDVLLGVYDSEKACKDAAVEQGVQGDCYPLIHGSQLVPRERTYCSKKCGQYDQMANEA